MTAAAAVSGPGRRRSTPITLAPIARAICATAPPTPPETPKTAMVSPAATCAVSTAPYQATTKLTPTVEASSKLSRSGLRTSASTGTDINSACDPSRMKPVSPPVPQTAAPCHSGGPLITTPAKSRPGVRGSTVQSIAPATFFTSDGLTDAASTRITASSAVPVRSGRSVTCNTPGSPNSVKRKARMSPFLLS